MLWCDVHNRLDKVLKSKPSIFFDNFLCNSLSEIFVHTIKTCYCYIILTAFKHCTIKNIAITHSVFLAAKCQDIKTFKDFILNYNYCSIKTILILIFFCYILTLLAAPVAIEIMPTAPTALSIETGLTTFSSLVSVFCSGSKQART